ncbi:MAG: carbon-nitrogen hydrolase family protein [Sedimentisphaerales bacterium]|nr:carbon-nitrogen hydrolase family protein [Sedimentisphaerales bacterium]
MAEKLKIATCQFAVNRHIKRNTRQIREILGKAKKTKADIVHFPECALSGYAGVEFANFDGFNWELLRAETQKIMSYAKELGLWIILGSTHPLTHPNKPHNCLYLIDPDGKIHDRYDKRFCMKAESRKYTPGDHFVTFNINGIKCSLLICFDVRFPELYRELYKLSVKCIFQSFYNARQKGPSIHTHIMRQSMQCMAASNGFWVSMANATGYYSPYPSCFIQPDGVIVKQLSQNRAGMMINTVDLNEKFYDPMAGIRELAIAGRLDNRPKGRKDRRSADRKGL